MPKEELKFSTLIEDIVNSDPELERMLAELPKDATLSEYCKVIDRWKKMALKKFRSMERTSKSAVIDSVEIRKALLDGCNFLPPNPDAPEGSCNEEMANAYGCDPPYGECSLRKIWNILEEKERTSKSAIIDKVADGKS